MTAEVRRARWLLVAALALLLAGAATALQRWAEDDDSGVADPLARFGQVAVSVEPADGSSSLAWCLLAALTADQRSQGLMGITDLEGFAGMAFIYDADVQHGFFMRNTPTPLSIAWISADGEVLNAIDMDPCGNRATCPVYPPGRKYRYAIEVPRGDLPSLGIVDGATVTVGGACSVG